MILTQVQLKEVKVGLGDVVTTGVYVLVVVGVAFAIYRIGKTVIRRVGIPEHALSPEAQVRARTARGLLLSAWKYVVVLGALVALLGTLGKGVIPAVALTSAAGLVVAFGAQSLFRDVLAGFSILLESWYVVGDAVRLYGIDVEGTIEAIGLRTTVVRCEDGSRVHVPNGVITAVRNLSARPAEVREARRARSPRSRPAQAGRPSPERPAPRVASAERAPEPPPPPPAPAEASAAQAAIFELPGRAVEAAGEAASEAAAPRRRRARRRGGRRRRGGERAEAPASGTPGPPDTQPDTQRPGGEAEEPPAGPQEILEESPWSIE